MANDEITETRRKQRLEAGLRVKAIRAARLMKAADLAVSAGLPRSTISSIENGTRGMPAEQRAKIAHALGVEAMVLDPASTPNLDIPRMIRENLPRPYESGPAPVLTVSEPRSSIPSRLPPGLEGFLERHPDISPRIRWYMENSAFRTEPWVVFDDAFWDEVATFWEKYLSRAESHPGRSRAKGGGTPPKG